MRLVVLPSSLEEVTLPSEVRKNGGKEVEKKTAVEIGVHVF